MLGRYTSLAGHSISKIGTFSASKPLCPLGNTYDLFNSKRSHPQQAEQVHRLTRTTFSSLAVHPNNAGHSVSARDPIIITAREMATPSSSSSKGESSDTQGTNQRPKAKFSVSKEELKARLSPIQYSVTQLKATERPGTGEYNKFNKKGTYRCVVCDEELFKSDAKYESGCGWPAFWGAADKNRLKFVQDHSLANSANLLLLATRSDLVRTEVLCGNCDAHLGHQFDDGPKSKGGIRYCINSAAMKFEPAKDQ